MKGSKGMERRGEVRERGRVEERVREERGGKGEGRERVWEWDSVG